MAKYNLPMVLLETKFHKPLVPDDCYCDRGRLKASPQRDKPLILLSAPAGYGKSTLLAQWIQQDADRAAFLSISRSDNHIQRFWIYFFSAVNRVFPEVGKTALSLLSGKDVPEIEQCIITFINEIIRSDREISLYIDDMHLVEEKAIYESLDFLIDSIPPSFRLILASREDLPLSVGRLRARGIVGEVRQNDLRLDRSETAQYLTGSLDLDGDSETVSLLYERSEGWITALQLAVTAIKSVSDRDLFIRNFSGNHSFVFDYLLEEVLRQLDGSIRDFLIETSLFREFDASLCDDYLDRTDSRNILRQIKNANLFLIPLDDFDKTFRYHHLFADFLLGSLKEKWTPGELKQKRLKALSLLDKRGRFDEAYLMGVEAEAWNLCEDLLLDNIDLFFREIRFYDFTRYLAMLPEETVSRNGDLYALSLWNHMEMVDPGFPFRGEPSPFLEGVWEMKNSYQLFYSRGDMDGAAKGFRKALANIPEKFSEIRYTAMIMLGAIDRNVGDMDEAEKAFLFDLKDDRFERRFYSALLQSVNRVEICLKKAEFTKAGRILDETFSLIKKLGVNPDDLDTGFLWVERATVSYYGNDLEEAYDQVRKGLSLSRRSGSDETVFLGVFLKSRIEIAMEKYDLSLKTVSAVLDEVGDSSSFLVEMFDAISARARLLSGKNIDPWAEEAGLKLAELKKQGELPVFLFMKYIIYPEYLIGAGRLEEAEKWLRYLTDGLLRRKRIVDYGEGRVLLARIKYRQNLMIEAEEILEELMEVTGGENISRIFAQGCSECASILGELEKKGKLPEYLSPYASRDEQRKKIVLEINDFQETFNDREVDILRYMARGLSNQEISDTIFLSINTVRWYARQLYSKLGVKRRGEAVVKARSLNLI